MCFQIYELTQEIAEWLSDDTQSLYSLCLVNRACFFSAARLLWRTPFCVGKVSSKSHLKVIRESLLFANCEERRKVNQILKQWSTSELSFRGRPPMLPYLSFVRTLDVEDLNILTYHWLNTLNPKKDYRKDIREIMKNGLDLSLIL